MTNIPSKTGQLLFLIICISAAICAGIWTYGRLLDFWQEITAGQSILIATIAISSTLILSRKGRC